MNWKEIALLLATAICVALVAATVIDAFAENSSTRGGFGDGVDPYSVSIVEPTRTEHPPLPTMVVTEEATVSVAPEPTATNDYDSTGDF